MKISFVCCLLDKADRRPGGGHYKDERKTTERSPAGLGRAAGEGEWRREGKREYMWKEREGEEIGRKGRKKGKRGGGKDGYERKGREPWEGEEGQTCSLCIRYAS